MDNASTFPLEDAMKNSLKRAVGSLLILQCVKNESSTVTDIYREINNRIIDFSFLFSIQNKSIIRLEKDGFLTKERLCNANNNIIKKYTITKEGIAELDCLKQNYRLFSAIVTGILHNQRYDITSLPYKHPLFIRSLKNHVALMLVLYALDQSDMQIQDIVAFIQNPLFEIKYPQDTLYKSLRERLIKEYKANKKVYYHLNDSGRFHLYRLIQKYEYCTKIVLRAINEGDETSE